MTTLPPTLSKSYAVGLPSPQKVASHTQSILTLPPQLTKVIRSVSDPLQRYDFSVKKYQFYY